MNPGGVVGEAEVLFLVALPVRVVGLALVALFASSIASCFRLALFLWSPTVRIHLAVPPDAPHAAARQHPHPAWPQQAAREADCLAPDTSRCSSELGAPHVLRVALDRRAPILNIARIEPGESVLSAVRGEPEWCGRSRP